MGAPMTWQPSTKPDPCPGCNADVIEVTAYGDRFPHDLVQCACPRPCCFLCEKPLTDDSRCQTTFCPLDGLLVPIPEMR